jgi:hypothetical protein
LGERESEPLPAAAKEAGGSGHEATEGDESDTKANEAPEGSVDVHFVLFSF